MRKSKKANIYSAIIERIFLSKFKSGIEEIEFEREDIARQAKILKIRLPKNLGDLIYSFRYRADLPKKIQATVTGGKIWIIRPCGRAKYKFCLILNQLLAPNLSMVVTKIPDSTPGIVSKYALNDEQALLAKVRYNRLIDIFTGVTCYSLQNHLRTTVPNVGQIETDEIYVGVDKKGIHYVFPVQAKGGNDKLGIVQIEQDYAACLHKFKNLVCRPIATKFMVGDVIAIFEFEATDGGLKISSEKHYKLVPAESISIQDLNFYGQRIS